MAKLTPGVDVSEQEAEMISSQIMEALHAIEAENFVLHNDIHIGNVVPRDGNRSPVVIDFGQANIREPGLSDEEWLSVVGASLDTRYMRHCLVNLEDGPWKRTVTRYEMSDPQYKNPSVFNKYVESMPHDFRRVVFEGALDTDWERAREKVHQWRIRLGVRCRPIRD